MKTLDEKALNGLARSASAMGKIIEAHADWEDRVCKVVIELPETMQNAQLREAIAQLWLQDGFIASVSQDGYLMIDGLRGSQPDNQFDLIAAVAHQIKTYTKASMQRDAQRELCGSDEMAVIAHALEQGDALRH